MCCVVYGGGVWPPSWWGVLRWCETPLLVGRAVLGCGVLCCVALCHVWWRVPPVWWGVLRWCVAPLMVGLCCVVLCCVAIGCGMLCCVALCCVWCRFVAPLVVGRAA